MSDRTPAEALARARYEAEQFDRDHPWFIGWDDVRPTLRQGLVEEAEDDIDHLAEAGFRVVPEPDDTTRALAERLSEHADKAIEDGPTLHGYHVMLSEDLLAAAAYLSGDGEG